MSEDDDYSDPYSVPRMHSHRLPEPIRINRERQQRDAEAATVYAIAGALAALFLYAACIILGVL
jgi:hypothetical protein